MKIVHTSWRWRRKAMRRTIQRDWAKAVAWIQYRIEHPGAPPPST